MTEFQGAAKYIEMFCKNIQKIVQYKAARTHVQDIFEEKVNTSHGIRFSIRYEQIIQIVKHGLRKIMNEIMPHLHAKKWSEKSTLKMTKTFRDNDAFSLEDLGLATIELAVMSQSDKHFRRLLHI